MFSILQQYILRKFGKKIISKWLVLCFDIMVTIFTFGIAYILRYNFYFEKISFAEFFEDLFFTTSVYSFAFLITKSYEGIIRHSGIADLQKLVKACVLAINICILLSLVTRYLSSPQVALLPASILLIHFLITLLLLIASRFVVKVIFMQTYKASLPATPVLIYGAGRSGIFTLHALQEDRFNKYKVIGFIDDDPFKKNKSIEGIWVYSAESVFSDFIRRHQVAEIIIAICDITVEKKIEIVDYCLTWNVRVKNIPHVNDWMKGHFNSHQIKDIRIEDLLEREQIQLDNFYVMDEIKDHAVLITGAAGSIGSELAKQVIFYKPQKLILIDQNETGLYELEIELRQKMDALPEDTVEFIICDITNLRRLTLLFNKYKPQVVLHAAAYKHVPVMELNPIEAVHTNIFGTKYLVDLSVANHVKKFVMISTDKAVNPSNIMGATKRVAEIYVQEQSKNSAGKIVFITTRFGNVLGSSGSVIPVFRRQISQGGPLTITHPDVSRYFMTIHEACQLVLEAGAMGKGGEIFIFDMGERVKIFDLAKKMILLSGLRLGADIQIIFTGLRPGEKLHEELLNEKENTLSTHHPKIMIAQVRENNSEMVKQCFEQLKDAINNSDAVKLVISLKELVPEFKSLNSIYEDLDIPDDFAHIATN